MSGLLPPWGGEDLSVSGVLGMFGEDLSVCEKLFAFIYLVCFQNNKVFLLFNIVL